MDEAERLINETQRLMKIQGELRNPPVAPLQASIFEHIGWPSDRQAAEFVGYIANAVTITFPSLGLAGFALNKLVENVDPLPGYLALIASVFLLPCIAWSWIIVWKGMRGQNRTDRVLMAKLFAFSFPSAALASLVGGLLGWVLA